MKSSICFFLAICLLCNSSTHYVMASEEETKDKHVSQSADKQTETKKKILDVLLKKEVNKSVSAKGKKTFNLY